MFGVGRSGLIWSFAPFSVCSTNIGLQVRYVGEPVCSACS